MNEIEAMLTGKMNMRDFSPLVQHDPRIQQELRDLIPPEAMDHPDHPFWKFATYHFYERFQFDVMRALNYIVKFNGSIGDNLNLFEEVKSLYFYHNPDLPYTSFYYDAHGLLLDISHDCYEGSEVNTFLEQIVREALSIKGKGKQRAYGKEQIKKVFHAEDGKRPYWIQGADWPCGKNSPMKYVGRTRQGECVYYEFMDVDTHEKRIVEQYY